MTEVEEMEAHTHSSLRSGGVPARAFPDAPGMVFKFSTSGVSHRRSLYPLDCRGDVTEYVHIIADELSSMSFPHPEGDTDLSPSVLIIIRDVDSIMDRAAVLRKNFSRRAALNFPYGTKQDRVTGKKKDFSSYVLSNVRVDSTTGLHYLYADLLLTDKRAQEQMIWKLLREKFDIILIAPDANKADSNLDEDSIEYSVVCEEDQCKIPSSNQNITTIALRYELHHAAVAAKTHDLVLINQPKLTEVDSKITVDQARAMVSPIIKHMLGMKLETTFNDVAPRTKLSIRATERAYDIVSPIEPEDLNIGMVASGIFASCTAFFGFALNSDFTLVDALITSVPVAALSAFGGGHVVQSAFPALIRKKNDKYGILAKKKIEAISSSAQETLSLESRNTRTRSEIGNRAVLRGGDSLASAPVFPTEAATEDSAIRVGLDDVTRRTERLRDKWMAYELNPEQALKYPLLLDASCEQTAQFYFAMSEVDYYESLVAQDSSYVAELRNAVIRAEKAFITAENNAKKMRYSYLDDLQRKRLKSALPLVALLKDEEASPHEKISAYRKAGDFLEGIVALPERPIMGLLEVR